MLASAVDESPDGEVIVQYVFGGVLYQTLCMVFVTNCNAISITSNKVLTLIHW